MSMKKKKEPVSARGELVLYQTEDGKTKIEVRLHVQTVWRTLNQMAELFQVDKSGISRHLKNIYQTGELRTEATIANFATVQKEGSRTVQRTVEYYNLDAIISVGYRVNSIRGTQFRIWATQRLREYVVKGFTMDDERLKQAGGGNYFDELLARIRDIRSAEKVFWRKVLDIYATSIDYTHDSESSMLFFQTVQNKMHWAVHGNTAAEIVYQRADSTKPNMGLTNFKGSKPTKQEAEIAKNYLNVDELTLLNRMVTAYIEMAEIQAMSKTPMYMKDWIARLDDFLKMTGKDILSHAGAVSHEKAIQKVNEEYMSYKERTKDELSHVEEDFIAYLDSAAKALKIK